MVHDAVNTCQRVFFTWCGYGKLLKLTLCCFELCGEEEAAAGVPLPRGVATSHRGIVHNNITMAPV